MASRKIFGFGMTAVDDVSNDEPNDSTFLDQVAEKVCSNLVAFYPLVGRRLGFQLGYLP